MRFFAFLLFLTGLYTQVFSQTTEPATPADTTIYEAVEIMPAPLIVSCLKNKGATWTRDSLKQCSEIQLLTLMAGNIRYPDSARLKNIEGTVVLSMVIEPNGRLSYPTIVRDIGGGCGREAVRVLKALDEAGLRWLPGEQDQKKLRVKIAMPIRFRLQESLPYYLGNQGDTLYTVFDSLPQFRGGYDSLATYLLNRLRYPSEYIDSCKTGVIEMALIIRKNGEIELDNSVDFNNLGLEFQFEALRLARGSAPNWTPAVYQGQWVSSVFPVRAIFKSPKAACKIANERFDRAVLLADEGSQLSEAGKMPEAIAKWTEAIALQPDNTEYLYYRGMAMLNENKREEACNDFARIKKILGITWFEEVRRMACGW